MRLIDADELIKHACRSTEWSHGEHPMVVEVDDIDDAPTVDAEPVKHGVWFGTVCSCCGASTSFSYDCEYCPHCGEKMVEYEDYESESGEGENHDND